MNHLEVLESALNQATQKGAFNLQDAAAVHSHLEAHKQEVEALKKENAELKKPAEKKK